MRPARQAGETTLLRLFNAGIETHVAQLQNLRGTLIAEDGWPGNYTRDQYSFVLQAGKTKDVLLTPAAARTYPVYDRRLRLTNANASPGGLLSYLEVAPGGPELLDVCPGDFDGDGAVSPLDLAMLAELWLQPCNACPMDMNNDGKINLIDYQRWINAAENCL